MSDEGQPQGQASGSVPHAYRTKLFWHWAPAMPKGLTSSFVAVLYALASASDPAGYVRFRDGKAIRIKDIAAACKVDEKDARRYLRAAIAAGVVGVKGEQRRGRAALYVLVLLSDPDWGAAVDSLRSTRRKQGHAAPWMKDSENGGVSPELFGTRNGGPTPELQQDPKREERGTHPRLSSGDTPPFGSGDTPPNIPGVIHGSSHDGAEVVVKAEVVGPSAVEPISQNQEHPDIDPPDFRRCVLCHERLIPDPLRPGRTAHSHCARRTA